MIQVGQKKNPKYWGKFTVQKVARLSKPIKCYSEEVGTVLFDPTLVKIKWEKYPSYDKHEFWFPYWVTIKDKEKYGQFAPMIGEGALLRLLRDAIQQGFFSSTFLQRLNEITHEKLSSK